MRIGVVSDTHGHLPGTHDAVRMLESLQVDVVLHCGDIGTPDVVACFSAWQTHFVFGNCDYDRSSLRAAMEAQRSVCHGDKGELELAGRRLALCHGHKQADLASLVLSQEYDLICTGHTHVARQEFDGKTVLLNPGAIYRANPHSIALVTLPEVEATIVPL